jgi:hypothetical protein
LDKEDDRRRGDGGGPVHAGLLAGEEETIGLDVVGSGCQSKNEKNALEETKHTILVHVQNARPLEIEKDSLVHFAVQNGYALLFALPAGLSLPCFLTHVVSSLAHPNLLGTKRLGCCCFCCWAQP